MISKARELDAFDWHNRRERRLVGKRGHGSFLEQHDGCISRLPYCDGTIGIVRREAVAVLDTEREHAALADGRLRDGVLAGCDVFANRLAAAKRNGGPTRAG